MTWEYSWLHGVTAGYRGYKGLQGVTGGYKGLRRVTRGDRGLTRELQGVTKDYRNFFLPERSQILFLGLFCLKIKVKEISNF